MYKIQNTNNDIKLIHPQNIAQRFILDDDTVKITGIILEKPYKLQITAVATVKGKRKKRVRNIEYNSTLKDAVSDAKALRTTWIKELKAEIKSSATNDIDKLQNRLDLIQKEIDNIILDMQNAESSEIPVLAVTLADKTKELEQEKIKLQKLESEVLSGGAITEMLTLDEAFEMYIKSQHVKFKAKKVSREYDEYRYRGVYNKHIKPSLGNKLLDNIDREDVLDIINNMTVSSRAVLDADGNKIPLVKSGVKFSSFS